MSETIACVGRRRVDVSIVDGKVQLRITLGDKPLAHLLLEWKEAQKLRGLLGETLEHLIK